MIAYELSMRCLSLGVLVVDDFVELELSLHRVTLSRSCGGRTSFHGP